MKKLLIIMITLALVAGVSVKEAKAATSDSIAVTVTMSNVSVSLDQATWVIGPIGTSGTDELAVVATNDGNVDEDLTISTTDSAGWTAGSAAGSEVFLMEFDLGTDGTFPGTEITTGGVALVGTLSPGTQDFHLQFTAPSSTTVGVTPQSITVTVSAAAS